MYNVYRYHIILLDQDENAMDTSEQQDDTIDGANVHQQDRIQANNMQDGGEAMNGIYLLICLLATFRNTRFIALIAAIQTFIYS